MASNYFDKASLVMIPDAPLEGKVLSVKPEDRSGDFTFSRSTAATRVNADGNIEKETGNLFLQSNSFDTSWTKNNVTTTSGQSGYDGSNDAWLLSKGAAAFTNLIQSVTTSGVNTFSVYAKSGTLTQLTLRDSATNIYARFNLSDGSLITTSGSPIATSIEDVGSGWYRCSITMSMSSASLQIYPDWSHTTAGNIYIQDAQVEQGLVARNVITTTTSAVYGGITDNLPRLDYTDSSCPSLLLEPQRSNLFAYSEYLSDGSGWADYSTTITTNAAISPEGIQNAATMEIQNTQSRLQYNANQGAGTYTFSVYARSDSPVGMRLRPSVDGAYDALYFTTTSEWKRYKITFTATTSVGLCQIRSYQEAAGNIEIFGFQLESGSYPTSYIPTYGTSVTRSVDFSNNNNILGTAYSSNNFSYFIEFELSQDSEISNSPMLFGGGDVGLGASGQCYLRIGLAGNNTLRLYGHGDILMAEVVYAFTKDTNYKVLVKRSGTDVSFFVNGVQIGSTQTSSIDFTLRSVGWSYNAGTYNIYGDVKQFLGFETALTDSECIALTTI